MNNNLFYLRENLVIPTIFIILCKLLIKYLCNGVKVHVSFLFHETTYTIYTIKLDKHNKMKVINHGFLE